MLARFLRTVQASSGHLERLGAPALTPAVCRLQHAQAEDHTEQSDLQEFRDTVHEFAQRTIAPHAAEIDQQNSFPRSVNLWKEIGDFGLHGNESQ